MRLTKCWQSVDCIRKDTVTRYKQRKFVKPDPTAVRKSPNSDQIKTISKKQTAIKDKKFNNLLLLLSK